MTLQSLVTTALAPGCWSCDQFLGVMHCRQQRRRKTTLKTFQNLPIISVTLEFVRLFSIKRGLSRDHHLFCPDPQDQIESHRRGMVRRWSPVSPLHLLTIPLIAADIITRFLSPDLVWTAQAHYRILGHERSLTQIKFNKEGDLLFSCSKDHIINVWFSHNGERLGTYEGHNGAVWTIDVDCTSVCPRFAPHEHKSHLHQHNPGSSYLAPPITPSDCGPSSRENACTSGSFPQR